jgi:hypothetical protein
MKTKILLSAVLTLTAVVGALALSNGQDETTQLSSKEALSLIRTMNSIEHSFKMKSSSFGSLEEVFKLGQLDRTKPGIVLSDGNSGTVKDYQLSVVASSDGRHYQISLRPGSACGVSFFTNEAGVIYQGQALGCPVP